MVIPSHLRKDRAQRTRRQFLSAWLDSCFGPTPDLHARHGAATLTSGFLLLPALILWAVTLFPGIGLYWAGVDGVLVGKITGLGGTIGFIPLCTAAIWAVRATISEVHYQRWCRSGSPAGELPPASSQPKDIDVILGIPWAIAMIVCSILLLRL
jgi:hypothetical protein